MITKIKEIKYMPTLTEAILKTDKIKYYMSNLMAENEFTYEHSINVALLSEKVAKKLKVNNIEDIVTGALLHDIGKIFVPSTILNKPSSLTDAEFDNIRLHPLNGLFYIMSDFNSEVNKIVRDHHEKLDGSGYFYGRSDISFGTQIVTVCDMYDAMTQREIYKEKYSPSTALMLLYKDADQGKLNSKIIDALSVIIRENTKQV